MFLFEIPNSITRHFSMVAFVLLSVIHAITGDYPVLRKSICESEEQIKFEVFFEAKKTADQSSQRLEYQPIASQ